MGSNRGSRTFNVVLVSTWRQLANLIAVFKGKQADDAFLHLASVHSLVQDRPWQREYRRLDSGVLRLGGRREAPILGLHRP